MAEHSYFLVLKGTAAANAKATLSYQVPATVVLELDDIVISGTGAFDIVDIRDSRGVHYTNASESVGIPNTVFKNAGQAYTGIERWRTPILIEGGGTLYVDVLDKSGVSNTVNVVFMCKRTLGGK